MQCSHLSQVDFDQLTLGAQVLEADSHGAKVYLLKDGNFLKVFRRKRLISSALLRPYSQRFVDNAERLAQLGIPTLEVISQHKLDLPGRTAVLYRPLPGRTLLQLSREKGFSWDSALPQLIKLIHQLHRNGIYFRSLHLGNVVMTPDQRLGLIDVADMRFLRPPLSARMVRRNVQHMVRYIEREKLGDRFPLDEFEAALLAR
ncbi:toluene tolerance protein [Pseudomonas sp. NPDC089428]|uniref:toluene tolerance protein n=1 Tax=unclassified Pseudomonas TaxID=196821 RepID=UPI0031DCD1FB